MINPPTPHPESPARTALSDMLAEERYVRSRLSPSVMDRLYLHLLDVREVIAPFAESAEGSVLDYGCGGAPYRTLFVKASSYVGADIAPGPRTDLIIDTDYSVALPDEQFDAVLSTQVLEHVAEPRCYLKEALRLLKPGGKLLLTTHGFFEEHGCPYDFHRWTAAGLEHELRAAGFEVAECFKLTTRMRAGIQLIAGNFKHNKTFVLPVRCVSKTCQLLFVPLLNGAGALLKRQAVVPAADGARWYIGVGAVGVKRKSFQP
jgi:SAM-dependent methyltransferase